jgi:hypothetical protein
MKLCKSHVFAKFFRNGGIQISKVTAAGWSQKLGSRTIVLKILVFVDLSQHKLLLRAFGVSLQLLSYGESYYHYTTR